MKFDACGFGNPLVDILINVDDDFLDRNRLNKGIMHLIGRDEKAHLMDLVKERPKEMQAGGSCPNTITVLSLLGVKAALTGKIGNDELGSFFENRIKQKEVHSYLRKEEGETGTSIIFITPDKERTMNTYLGVCREYRKEDFPEEMIKNSSLFYFTGYMWDTENQKAAVTHALELAKRQGIKTVFDVADPFAVRRYKEDFLKIINDYVDIVLANRQEFEILTGKETCEGVRSLSPFCNSVVVKNGKEDTIICNEKQIISIPSYTCSVKDTTGAGDNFAAGFLYGLIKNYPFSLCGKIASFVASKAIEKIGAQAPHNIKEMVEEMVLE